RGLRLRRRDHRPPRRPGARRGAAPPGPRRADHPLRGAGIGDRTAAARLPAHRRARPRPPRLRRRAAQLRPRLPARAVPDQPGRRTPRRTRRVADRGRPAVGRRAGRAGARAGRRPPPPGAQPRQPADPAHHHPDRPGPGHPGGPGAVRPGPAARTPPPAPRRHRGAQPVLPGPAGLGRPGRPRGAEVTGPDWRETAEQAVSLPYGRARSTALEKALQQAVRDGAGEEDLFWLRMSLTQAYEYGGEPANAFATFTRCLSAFDADPARYGPVARSQ